MNKKLTVTFVLVMSIGIGVYAVWYTHHRQAVIAETTRCNNQLAHPETAPKIRAPDGTLVPGIQPCLLQATPPPLFDLIRGRVVLTDIPLHLRVNTYSFLDILIGQYPLVPDIILPCDQSATTSDCASIASSSMPLSLTTLQEAATTTIISHFAITYPQDVFLMTLRFGGIIMSGGYRLNGFPEARNGGNAVDIFIDVNPRFATLTGLNPVATTLDGYRTDYLLSATSTWDVLVRGAPVSVSAPTEARILSNEDVMINGVPILKQRYSIGRWSLNAKGQHIFDTSNETDTDNQLRYIFFDGVTFVSITGWRSDPYIDQIMQSVRLIDR